MELQSDFENETEKPVEYNEIFKCFLMAAEELFITPWSENSRFGVPNVGNSYGK